jgi:hypothetical protein
MLMYLGDSLLTGLGDLQLEEYMALL